MNIFRLSDLVTSQTKLVFFFASANWNWHCRGCRLYGVF
jgi:hypothetical protein